MRRVTRLLSFLGAAGFVLGLSKVHAAYVADPPYDLTGSSRFAWVVAYILLLWIAGYGFGLPDLPRSAREAALVATGVSASAAVMVSIIQLLVGDALLPRFVVVGSALLLIPWQVAVNALARRGRSRDEGRDRVLLVGPREVAEALVVDLSMAPERFAALVGSFEVAEARTSLGIDKPLVETAIETSATMLVLDRTALADGDIIAQAAALHEAGLRVRSLLEFYEQWLGKLPVSELERASLFFDISELHQAWYGRVKRMIDVLGALGGLLAMVVVTPMVAIGNLVANRGSLIYRQDRVGRDGKIFSILKFRTMRPTDGAMAPTNWTTEKDPRITPFGRFLRASHLDELPQVVNILRGDLSIVGPRPEQPHYVETLSRTLPFYGMRHLVRPGLTGWAQVKYGYTGDEEDALEKLQYEFFYLSNQRLGFDVKVMARTIRSVAGSEGGGR